MAFIEERLTRDGVTYRVTWDLPRALVPAGQRRAKGSVTVYEHAHALLVKRWAEEARHAVSGEQLADRLAETLQPRPVEGLTVGEWAEQFLVFKEGDIRGRTLATYRTQIGVFAQAFGHRPLAELSGLEVKKFLRDLKDGANPSERKLSNASCDRYFAAVKHMLNVAKMHGKVSDNVALQAGWKVGRRDADREEDEEAEKFFEPEEYKLLIAQFRPDYRLFARFLGETGCRFSEATGLKVKNLDFKNDAASIKRSWSGKDFDLPKSGRARTIEVRPKLMRDLHTFLRDREPEDHVFRASRGGKIANTNFRRDHWNPAMTRIKQCPRHLPERIDGRSGLVVFDPKGVSHCDCLGSLPWTSYTPHALRHTYATWMIRSGRSLTLVANQLGHTTTKTTEQIYTHLSRWWQSVPEGRLSRTTDELLGD